MIIWYGENRYFNNLFFNRSPKEPEAPKWTPQDEAARKIQTGIRGFLSRKKLEKLKKEKQDYNDLMDKLEKEVTRFTQWVILSFRLLYLKVVHGRTRWLIINALRHDCILSHQHLVLRQIRVSCKRLYINWLVLVLGLSLITDCTQCTKADSRSPCDNDDIHISNRIVKREPAFY